MRYLGMDVHAKSTVWCLLDAQGEVRREGKVPTSATGLTALVQASHVLLARCRRAEAAPLQAIRLRIRGWEARL